MFFILQQVIIFEQNIDIIEINFNYKYIGIYENKIFLFNNKSYQQSVYIVYRMEKIFISYIFDKELICRIYKDI